LLWCERPLAQWPVELEGCPFDLDEPIIDRWSATLTEFGEDLARASDPRLDSNLVDEAVFGLLRGTAAEHPDLDVYRPFRRFLIEHPVLIEDEFRMFRGDLPAALVESARAMLDLAYRPWIGSRSTSLTICGRCRNSLASGDGPPRCLTPWCQALDGGVPTHVPVAAGSEWYEQRRGVRLYISLPGLAELDLERRLNQIRGVQVRLWPGPPGRPDVYDLAIEFSNGEVWAADVKDHHHPFRLGQTKEIPPVYGTETRRILVVPAWRMSRPDYRQRAYAQVVSPSIELIDSDQLVHQARRKARRLAREASS
jgi:hypothetical protein